MVAILATVFAALAALLHVYIFVMESVQWTQPRIWRRFGVADQAAADTTKPMAYNQGFYNLFLAIGVVIGLVLVYAGADSAPLRAAGSRPCLRRDRAWRLCRCGGARHPVLTCPVARATLRCVPCGSA